MNRFGFSTVSLEKGIWDLIKEENFKKKTAWYDSLSMHLYLATLAFDEDNIKFRGIVSYIYEKFILALSDTPVRQLSLIELISMIKAQTVLDIPTSTQFVEELMRCQKDNEAWPIFPVYKYKYEPYLHLEYVKK